MIVVAGARRASVVEDDSIGVFTPEQIIAETFPMPPAAPGATPVRATVEIIRHGGGLMPRALVGATYTPGVGDLVVEVGTTGEELGGAASCKSDLGKALVPGLPNEFARAVISGLVCGPLVAGRLVVDRGGFDPVESSPAAFGFAAGLLAVVLAAKLANGDVAEAVRRSMDGSRFGE